MEVIYNHLILNRLAVIKTCPCRTAVIFCSWDRKNICSLIPCSIQGNVYIYIFFWQVFNSENCEERNVLQCMKHHKKNVYEMNNWVWAYIPVGVCICVNVRRILVWVCVMSVFPQDIDWFFTPHHLLQWLHEKF